LRERRESAWTIDPVLTELWQLLRRETSVSTADRLVAGLLRGRLRREALEADDSARVFEIGRAWPDQTFSLTDRQAFASIERSGTLRAWSYDRDFAIIRLGRLRDQPLDVVM
jgi:predicted nucleic acid-binding protein